MLAESLTRPRLADLYEMAGRLLVATALAFCLAGIFYLFVTYVGRFNTYLNSVLAAIIFLVLFEPLQTEVETRIHQFFFRERYDLETTVTALRQAPRARARDRRDGRRRSSTASSVRGA